MAERTRTDTEDGASCAREHGQEQEESAHDEQALPATQSPQQYKYNLVNPPIDETICPVCLDLAIKPFLVECCGQHFCQQCLMNVRVKGNICPLCRENAPSAVHDKYFERNMILKQQVRCSEKENGCQWVGLLGELEHHMTKCQFVKESCPYKCGNGVQRRRLEEHKANLCPQRPFVCDHCDYSGTYREVISHHWFECDRFPLPCPNNCQADKIPRGQLQRHCDSECPLQEVTCEFSHAGCNVQVIRQDLSQHMTDAAQQHMALVSRTLLQDKEREIAELKQQLRVKEKQHTEEMAKKDGQHKKELAKKDGQQKEEIAKKDGEHKEELAKKDRQHKEEMEKKDKQHKEMVERMSRLEDMIRDLTEKTNRMQCVLGAGDRIIVFTDFQKKCGNNVGWYSPPYYTHPHGYKMCVNVDLHNYFGIIQLCVHSYLLPGEYDASLQWPFRGTVLVQLLNQLSDNNHYVYTFDYSQASDEESQRVTSGKRSDYMIPSTPRLPITALEYNSSKKCQYLKDDCLKFKVVVNNLQ